MIDGICKVLQDEESGAEKCILDVCIKLIKQQNQVVLDDGGWFRWLLMCEFGNKIENELVDVLCVLFSNGNSKLSDQDYDIENNKDDVNRLWRYLLSEPQIVWFEGNMIWNTIK